MKIHIITNNSHFEVHVSLHGNLRASVLVIIGQGRKEKVADKLCVFEVSCDGGNNWNLRPSFYFGERLREICINWHFSTSTLVPKSVGMEKNTHFKSRRNVYQPITDHYFLDYKFAFKGKVEHWSCDCIVNETVVKNVEDVWLDDYHNNDNNSSIYIAQLL